MSKCVCVEIQLQDPLHHFKDCPLHEPLPAEHLSFGPLPEPAVHEAVDHPKHYTFGKIEVITVIDDWKLGFAEGNAVKYIARAKHKSNELEDLRKARWYLEHAIKMLEGT